MQLPLLPAFGITTIGYHLLFEHKPKRNSWEIYWCGSDNSFWWDWSSNNRISVSDRNTTDVIQVSQHFGLMPGDRKYQKRYGGGRRATVVTSTMGMIVKRRLKRNPRRSATKLADDLNVSDRSLHRILKDKLQTKPYKVQKVQDYLVKQK